MFPKFVEDCNRLPPDGAADLARCMELCAHHRPINSKVCGAHSTYRSTMPVRELSANDSEVTTANNCPNLNPLQISCLGAIHGAFWKASSEAKYSF